jgi:hypothetical protein
MRLAMSWQLCRPDEDVSKRDPPQWARRYQSVTLHFGDEFSFAEAVLG